MDSLPGLCLALSKAGDAGTLAARILLGLCWSRTRPAIERGLQLTSPSRREETLSELGCPLGAVLGGTILVGATDLRDEAAEVLCRDGERSSPPSRFSGIFTKSVVTNSASVQAGSAAGDLDSLGSRRAKHPLQAE